MTNTSTTRSERRLQLSNILLGITGIVAYAVSMFTSGAVSVVITAIGLLGFLVTLGLLIRRRKRFGPIVKAVAISLLAVIAGSYLILFLLIFSFKTRSPIKRVLSSNRKRSRPRPRRPRRLPTSKRSSYPHPTARGCAAGW